MTLSVSNPYMALNCLRIKSFTSSVFDGASHLLDGLVFASPTQPFAAVMVAGRWVQPVAAQAKQHYRSVMQAVWPTFKQSQ